MNGLGYIGAKNVDLHHQPEEYGVFAGHDTNLE